jgi:REP element-mobilizing transposase RayT
VATIVSPAARARSTSRGPSTTNNPARRRSRAFRNRTTSFTRGLSTDVITTSNLATPRAAMSGGSRRDESGTFRPQRMRGGIRRGTIGAMYKPRIEVPGGYYHAGSRGNNQQPIFLTEYDRRLFLLLLARTARRYGWSIVAYCLMTNHYHLVLQLADGGLSRGMCELNGGYALGFNIRHGRRNHLFGRRFWDETIESERHLLEACRYVVLNPERAGLVADPASWRWSSYRATAGLELPPAFLAVGQVLGWFATKPAAATAAYVSFVSKGLGRRQPLRRT